MTFAVALFFSLIGRESSTVIPSAVPVSLIYTVSLVRAIFSERRDAGRTRILFLPVIWMTKNPFSLAATPPASVITGWSGDVRVRATMVMDLLWCHLCRTVLLTRSAALMGNSLGGANWKFWESYATMHAQIENLCNFSVKPTHVS